MSRKDRKRTFSAESKKRTFGTKFITLRFYLYLLLDIKSSIILFISSVRYKSKNNATITIILLLFIIWI